LGKEIIIGGAMKKLKVCLVLAVTVGVLFAIKGSIAQTFGNSKEKEYNTTSTQKIIVELLRQEIKENSAFIKDADNINYELNFASERDAVAPECFKYTPLLVDAVNAKMTFSSYVNIQGNFGYTFEGEDKTSVNFNFYEQNDEEGNFSELVTTVSIQKSSLNRELNGDEAVKYINDNYCEPLNTILDQNKNLPIPQLLKILKQHFSK